MCERNEVCLPEINDPRLIEQLRHVSSRTPPLSEVDVMVVALAIEQRTTLLTEDNGVRMLAMAQNVPVIGSIGMLIRARLDGMIAALNPCSTSSLRPDSIWIHRVMCTVRRCSALARAERRGRPQVSGSRYPAGGPQRWHDRTSHHSLRMDQLNL
jgi:hypothetical protein